MLDRISTFDADDHTLEAGSVVGEYVVQEVVGHTGRGTVYRATHPAIRKESAIKVLSLIASSDAAATARFIAEARGGEQILGSNVVDIFAFGQLPDGRNYYVMKMLEGVPLEQFLARSV